MEAFFLKLVNLSITAGWLVAFVLVLRLVFRKAPRWIFCLLWGLAALRLVLPFSLESPLSLVPSAETVPPGIVYEAAPAIDSGIPVLDQAINPVISQNFAPATTTISVNPLQVVIAVAAWIWLLGLAAMVLYSAVSFLLLKRRVRTATLLRDNVRQSEHINSPFVLGFFRPTVYLPYSISGDDLPHVIAHEHAHIRRGDHWWKAVGFLILAVYWFNPLLWLAYILFCRDMELACDEKVVADMEKEARQAYSTALLNCSIRRRSLAACPLAFGEVGVKDRVKGVMNYKKPAFWIILIALLACIAAAVCFLTVPESDNSRILAEDGSGLPAPQGGMDPYADLEGSERAAAFLKNADKFSYELGAISMYGTYIVPVMEYVPPVFAQPDRYPEETPTSFTDRSDYILEMLHRFDLSALESMEIEDFEAYATRSGIAYVGDACCRVAVWNAGSPVEDPSSATALVFTFSDGTMFAFDGGPAYPDNKLTDIVEALNFAGSEQGFLLSPKGTGGNVTATKLSTGESRALHPAASAYVECIFENTPLLSNPVKTYTEFPWKIEIRNGATYWYNAELKLLLTEDHKVYTIGGFENQDGDFIPMETLVNTLVTNGFEES